MRILIFFLLITTSVSAQLNENRGSVHKVVPTKPYENILTGIIEVTKSMYGLEFKDQVLSKETKKTVEMFFKERLNGYNDLKKYTLRLEKRIDGVYIDDYKLR